LGPFILAVSLSSFLSHATSHWPVWAPHIYTLRYSGIGS
jgi:hypothetical protein